MGIEEVLSTPRSPWQRAYIERVIGSIRRECLDQVIVFNESSLRRILASYFDYYHRSRTHLAPGERGTVNGGDPARRHTRVVPAELPIERRLPTGERLLS
jgi:transposase InsO family protein